MDNNRFLILEDGSVFEGYSFGKKSVEKNHFGEIVFTTAMTGYQEAITDQSYNGQILTFTYPLVGNCGINRNDFESITPTVRAVIVNEYAKKCSGSHSQVTLDDFLKKFNIPGIYGVDTRALVKKIRNFGSMRATITDNILDKQQIVKDLQNFSLPTDNVYQVSTKSPYTNPNYGYNVAILDFGLKSSILKELIKRNISITVLPHDTPVKTILDLSADGLMLSNGPGDPKNLPNIIENIKILQEKLPIFGICLGHQLLSLANGADTYKLKFGHRGHNHAVKDLRTNRIDFTSQNHGYAVSAKSCENTDIEITHINIQDECVEGIRHKKYPVFSVQFHPDASPGPNDASYLFDDFVENIKNQNLKK